MKPGHKKKMRGFPLKPWWVHEVRKKKRIVILAFLMVVRQNHTSIDAFFRGRSDFQIVPTIRPLFEQI